MYLAGKGVDRNLNKALKYLRLSVEQENPVGMSNLGTLYIKGDIINQKYQEGLKLYQSAASKGLPGAWYIWATATTTASELSEILQQLLNF